MPDLRGKSRELARILRRNKEDRGVTICPPHTDLRIQLAASLRSGPVPVVQIDSRVTDSHRERVLSGFKMLPKCILIITRETGKRGLDLPQADFALFYSPKCAGKLYRLAGTFPHSKPGRKIQTQLYVVLFGHRGGAKDGAIGGPNEEVRTRISIPTAGPGLVKKSIWRPP